MSFWKKPTKKTLFFGLAVAMVAIVAAGFSLRERVQGEPGAADYKDASYLIDGNLVILRNGLAEREIDSGTPSASKIITRYFGNELRSDLDGDGRLDVVFLITEERGGSGVFYYAVAALNTERGYIGSDGYFLGDRIAPQTTEVSPTKRHKRVVLINYADRAPEEPMTASPSIGKSVYLKLDTEDMRWGVVVPDFEGESR
jgi:hypothetical protein